MIVAFSDEARRDLEEIGDHIARENPNRAESFIKELVEKCLDLANFPQAFPLVERYARLGIRKRRYRSYLIFYRTTDDRVEIVHVLHGARDYDAVLDN
ncbi:MAG: type II toxin-antitoxin system RelE/ParE family toxin [Novosphingobium sp.]|nr:type II toxin-antitoxin system RelE/ParE family toxin [Novosphingobium sp.]